MMSKSRKKKENLPEYERLNKMKIEKLRQSKAKQEE